MRFKATAIIIILILSALLVEAQRRPQNPGGKVWLLEGNRRAYLGDFYFQESPDHNIIAVAIIPELVSADTVGAAWTYAIRYGADGLDLPNFERAIELLMERHPTWQVYGTSGYIIRYGLYDASLDIQEATLTPEATSNP